MRIHLMLASVAAAGLMALPAGAQDGGQHADGLKRVLAAVAAGTCPADLMAGDLMTTCQQQIAAMGPGLASLGPIETATFIRPHQSPLGAVELYSVKFQRLTMTWAIGGFADGKYSILYNTPNAA